MSGFLSRWSARKAEARQTQTDPVPARPAGEEPDPAAASPQPLPDPEILAPDIAESEIPDPEIAAKLAALPALEEIGATTDIRPFLADFVPAALRKAAMRRAWAADPIISTHLDVARDYAWEFNTGELPVGFAGTLDSDAVQRGLDALDRNLPEPPEPPPADADEAPPREEVDIAMAVPEDSPQDALEGAGDDPVAQAPPQAVPPRLRAVRKHGAALPG
jgi:hypothetical protein